MKPKYIAIAFLATMALLLLCLIFENEFTAETNQTLSLIGGLGIWVFGIWQSIIILKLK